jgi:hypothetical protein
MAAPSGLVEMGAERATECLDMGGMLGDLTAPSSIATGRRPVGPHPNGDEGRCDVWANQVKALNTSVEEKL